MEGQGKSNYCMSLSCLSLISQLSGFRCFGHVVNIANITVMGWITKIAAVENTNMIWEYVPSLPNNHILGGSLDVIVAICTIAVKVC